MTLVSDVLKVFGDIHLKMYFFYNIFYENAYAILVIMIPTWGLVERHKVWVYSLNEHSQAA